MNSLAPIGRLLFSLGVATLLVPATRAAIQLAIVAEDPLTHNLSDTISLLPNTAGQTVNFYIQNNSSTAVDVGALSLYIQVGDGTTGPAPTSVDLAPVDSIFNGNHTPTTGATPLGDTYPTVAYATLTTQSGAVTLAAHSQTTLATVTFDTTGFSLGMGPWSLSSSTTAGSGAPTQYNDLAGITTFVPTQFSGQLAAVPEPESGIGIAVILLLGWTLFRAFRPRENESCRN